MRVESYTAEGQTVQYKVRVYILAIWLCTGSAVSSNNTPESGRLACSERG